MHNLGLLLLDDQRANIVACFLVVSIVAAVTVREPGREEWRLVKQLNAFGQSKPVREAVCQLEVLNQKF